jgi:hypothetical protein
VKQPEPVHTITTIEQYEQERAAVLERCPLLGDTFIYAPGGVEFAPDVRAHVQKLLYAALTPERLDTFARRLAEQSVTTQETA